MKEYLLEVVRNEPCAADTWRMVLRCTRQLAQAVRPGQFAHIALPGRERILRRPLDIFDADEANRTITLVYAVKGEGTRALANVRREDALNVMAPLGNGFPDVTGKKIFLLGGGLGVTPLYAPVRRAASSTAFLGWRSKEQVFALDEFLRACTELNAFTEDGTLGQQGRPLEALCTRIRFEKPDMLLACGPVPMLKALQAAALGVETYVALEQRMGCGIGACLACACKVKTAGGFAYKRVCADGPIFNIREVEMDA